MNIERIFDGSEEIGNGNWKTCYRFEDEEGGVYETRYEIEGDFMVVFHGCKSWIGRSAWDIKCIVSYEIESKQADIAAFKRLLENGYIEDGGQGEILNDELNVLNEVVACLAKA